MSRPKWWKNAKTQPISVDIDMFDLQSMVQAGIYWFKINTPFCSFPLIVAKGRYHHDGPVFGLNAAIHGDEVNGIFLIHQIIHRLDLQSFCGTIVAIPSINLEGLINKTRFYQNVDLNRMMPGSDTLVESPITQYTSTIHNHLYTKFDYLFDLHTATTGCNNTFYIRADLTHEIVKQMAFQQHAHIILNNNSESNTLRMSLQMNNIPAITLEIGAPRIFQPKLIELAYQGIMAFMLAPTQKIEKKTNTVICNASEWLLANSYGIMKILVNLEQNIRKDMVVAHIYDYYGKLQQKIYAPDDGIIIGVSTDASCQPGARVIHLGK